ncbi:MAG TPA: copper chaperone PCu(A)C [Caulobacterales bacterium]|nr:copper chaperone PCu(A)C [Caulobacterales bacterium]
MKWTAIVMIAALTACNAPTASQPHQPQIEISDAWARPTPGGVDVAAGYLTITNHGANEDELVSASSPRAGSVMVHMTEMSGGMMSMHEAQGLAVPAGGTLTLRPNGAHIMFQQLTSPFTIGESVPVTLHFAHAGDVDTSLVVRQDAN